MPLIQIILTASALGGQVWCVGSLSPFYGVATGRRICPLTQMSASARAVRASADGRAPCVVTCCHAHPRRPWSRYARVAGGAGGVGAVPGLLGTLYWGRASPGKRSDKTCCCSGPAKNGSRFQRPVPIITPEPLRQAERQSVQMPNESLTAARSSIHERDVGDAGSRQTARSVSYSVVLAAARNAIRREGS